jgi:hypothetical protein
MEIRMMVSSRHPLLVPVLAGLLAAIPAGTGLARPSPDKAPGMPDLSALELRTDPRVHAEGRIIKGLYYAAGPDGPNALVAFFNACDHRLEGHPFLVVDFGTQRYYFDPNRDGRLDEVGPTGGGIDPVPFAKRGTGWSTYCYGEPGQAM